MLQVLLDHLFGHLPYRGTEVPSRPEVPAPAALHLEAKADRLKAGGLNPMMDSQK